MSSEVTVPELECGPLGEEAHAVLAGVLGGHKQMGPIADECWVVVATVAGSVAFNVHRDLSDKDFFGVYAAPTADVVGLGSLAEETLTASEAGGDDYAMHELGKFGRLLLKGNPGIIEALFNDGDVYAGDAWAALRAHRSAFLSQSVCRHYLGYIKSQRRQYEREQGSSTKKLYHVLRLIGELERIVAGGCPTVRMAGQERDRLIAIRQGDEDPAAILAEADARVAAIKAAEPWDHLPAVGDEELLLDWLLRVRRGEFAS